MFIHLELLTFSDEEISSESESLQKDRAGLVIARETKVLPDGRLCIADEPIDKMCLNDANKVLELPLLFTKVRVIFLQYISM